MRRLLFVLSAVTFILTLALFPGCNGDGSNDNPSGPDGGDTLTTDEVLQELEDLTGTLDATYQECDPTNLIENLGAASNVAELDFLVVVLDSAASNGGDLSPFYGTWEGNDSTIILSDVIQTDTLPAAAVRIKVVGVDTTGASIPGDITIKGFYLDEATDSVYFDAVVHVDGSPDSASLVVAGSFDFGSLDVDSLDLSNMAGSLVLDGNACDFSFHVAMTIDGTDQTVVVDGWYAYPGDPTVYFDVSGSVSTDGGDTTGSTAIHVWTTDDPAIDITMTVTSDEDTCVTGAVTIGGSQEVEIVGVDCTEDTATVLFVIDGHTYTAEEVLGDLYDLLFGFDYGTYLKHDTGERAAGPWALVPSGQGVAEVVERLFQ